MYTLLDLILMLYLYFFCCLYTISTPNAIFIQPNLISIYVPIIRVIWGGSVLNIGDIFQKKNHAAVLKEEIW